MCGRFTQYYTWPEIHRMYSIVPSTPRNLQPRYNISPTDPVGVITRARNGDHTYTEKRWWLVPNWWKKSLKEAPAAFNARAETVAEKPMFRSAFRSKRCLIPASGFFEWTGPKESRQPWFISAKNGMPLTFAGLHELWRDPENNETVESCTIIVTAGNNFMNEIHDRMPVILPPETWNDWLSEPRLDLLKPAEEDNLQAWKVTPKVNSNRYQEADSVVSLSDPAVLG